MKKEKMDWNMQNYKNVLSLVNKAPWFFFVCIILQLNMHNSLNTPKQYNILYAQL